MKWYQWDPARFPDNFLIGQMLEKMPQSPIKEMPKVITTLENPDSLFYLPGPASIEIHDVMHCIVQRGLRSQDEAFVIGFTMGAAEGANTSDRVLFKKLSSNFYPKPFDFSDDDFDVYDIGYDLGLANPKRNLHLLDPRELKSITWDLAVNSVDLDLRLLAKSIRTELKLGITSKASERLETTIKSLESRIGRR